MKASAVSETGLSERKQSTVVVVLGMMGAGKTTVGRVLAELMNVPSVDSDDLIAERAGMPAADQLRADVAKFRQLEAECIVESLQSEEAFVLSIGGGAPATAAVADALQQHAPVVWVNVPEDELFRRIQAHENDRPSLDGDPRERLHQLLIDRSPAYELAADVIVDGVGSPDVVAQRILGVIR
jgi:shikimate kinase